MNDLISRKEAIDAIRESASKYSRFFMGMEMYTDDDAVEAIEGLPSAQKWIPINKSCPHDGKLPDRCVLVLVSIEDDVYEAYRSGSGDSWIISNPDISFSRYFSRYLNGVDAWMPKPNPYKGEVQ